MRLNIAATLEADADADGFGDETQDACPADPALQDAPCDRVAPDTQITQSPEAKGRKKTATFAFTSSEPELEPSTASSTASRSSGPAPRR